MVVACPCTPIVLSNPTHGVTGRGKITIPRLKINLEASYSSLVLKAASTPIVERDTSHGRCYNETATGPTISGWSPRGQRPGAGGVRSRRHPSGRPPDRTSTTVAVAVGRSLHPLPAPRAGRGKGLRLFRPTLRFSVFIQQGGEICFCKEGTNARPRRMRRGVWCREQVEQLWVRGRGGRGGRCAWLSGTAQSALNV